MTTAKTPIAVWALTINSFAIGTTEFISVGILPTIADGLSVTIALAGLVASAYALGVTISAPIMTALTSHLPRKPLLLGTMIVFTLGNVLAAMAPTFEVLLLARVLTALGHGIFFGIGSIIAADLVAPERRASAIALMFSGFTVAIVTGVPLGTFIGQQFGWRATFWAVAALGILALAMSAALLPAELGKGAKMRIRDQFRVLANGRLLLVYAMTVLGYGGTFVALTYLSPILQEVTGFSETAVSTILVGFGAAIAIGNIGGGWVADTNPVRALLGMFFLQSITLVVFTFTSASPTWALLTLVPFGLLTFSNVPALQIYVVQLAKRHTPDAVDVASAFNIASFNLGIAIGSYVGGLVSNSSLGLHSTPWVAAIFVGSAILLTLWSGALDRRSPVSASLSTGKRPEYSH
ncbi:MFS transporter [Brucella sp. IR073]|uniref:MFS transporter n=1 Tax=unclassified Brucella TaxID=2632610 RepID=UPI003B984703